jgi:hypothetical protein
MASQKIPHPYSAIQALNLQSDGVLPGEKHQSLAEPRATSSVAAHSGTLAEHCGAMKDGDYEHLAKALAEFKVD